MELTEQQVMQFVIGGTFIMLALCFTIIVIVLVFNRQNRKRKQELDLLREHLKNKGCYGKGNTEDEFLHISNGRKVKNRNWKGNNEG